MMSEFEAFVTTQLTEIREISARNEQALQDLSGPQGRLTALEAKVSTQDSRHFWKSILFGPGAVTLHIIANKLGLHL